MSYLNYPCLRIGTGLGASWHPLPDWYVYLRSMCRIQAVDLMAAASAVVI